MKDVHTLYKNDIADLQQAVFEESTRYKFEIDYKNFVEKYMTSFYRESLDSCNARLANMTWDEFLSYLEKIEGLFLSGTTDIDRLQAGWIGRMYSLLQSETKKSSVLIYNSLPYEKMKQVFLPLHTIGEETALSKLKEIMLQGNFTGIVKN